MNGQSDMNERTELKSKHRDILKCLKDGLSYARSLFFTNPLIYFYTGVMGSLSLIGSIVDSGGRWQHTCARTWSWLILKTSRITVEVEGEENVHVNRPTIYCVNHPSAMDIPILFVHLKVPFRFLSKRVLFHVPFLGWHLRRSGHIPVERGKPHDAMRSFELAARKIREGRSVVLFPEGARSPEGQLGEFKRGTFLLAVEAQAPVVPITLNGTRDTLPPGSYHVRPGTPEMIIHPPIKTDGLTTGGVTALSERVRKQVASRFHFLEDGEAGG